MGHFDFIKRHNASHCVYPYGRFGHGLLKGKSTPAWGWDLPASIEVPLSNGMEVSVPLFTLKYGNVSLPIMCDKADCHVDDLILAFQDESFVRNVIKYGDV